MLPPCFIQIFAYIVVFHGEADRSEHCEDKHGEADRSEHCEDKKCSTSTEVIPYNDVFKCSNVQKSPS